MKKVIIGIHGLGNKPEKKVLQKWWSNSMLEGLSLIGVNKKLPLFEMVYWADVLHEKPLNELTKDEKDPYFIGEPYAETPQNIIIEPHSFRQKIIDFVTEQLNKIFLNDDKTLNYSFISDAILKKYFTDLEVYYNEECTDENNVTCEARKLIRDKFVKVISKYKNYDIMIIAHSMGSIVAYDVLNFLIPETKISTMVTIGSPLGLPIVVSKIAAEQKRKFNGLITMATPPGIYANWFNLADIMDNVALNYKLADDFIGNETGIVPMDYLVNNNYEINGVKNPHKSYGYLRTSEFAKILDEFIGEQEKNIAQKLLDSFQTVFEKVKAKQGIIKDKLNLN